MPCESSSCHESQAFEYATLDPQTRAMVKQCTDEVKSLTKRTSIDTVKIGANVLIVKQRLKYGQFGKWLEAEFGWSYKMAYRFINVNKCFSCVNLTELDIPPSALYDLAESATPEAARQEAIQRARQGESISHSKAQKIIDRHKNPPILPEVLPSQPAVKVHEEITEPLVTITVEATPPSELVKEKGQLEERSLVSVQESSNSQKHPNVNPKFKYYGQLDQEVDGNSGREEYTQAANGLQAEPAIKVLSIEVDASKLRENTLQVFEVVSPGIRIEFQSHPGTAVSLFQQLKEFPSSVLAA